MIGAGAMLLQCRPRTSAFSEVPSRISMKSYLDTQKKEKETKKQRKRLFPVREIEGERWRVYT